MISRILEFIKKPQTMNKVGKSFNNKFKVLFLAVLLMGGISANAQLSLPSNSTDVQDAVEDTPIDGFLSIGLIAGAAIGLRKKFKGKEIEA